MSLAEAHGGERPETGNDVDPGVGGEPEVAPKPAAGFTVLYDADCPVCRRARAWAEGQDQLVPLRFLPAGGAQARQRFPDLDHAGTLIDITTIGDDGAIRRGKSAWITVLWAVDRTRTLANDLAAGRKLRTFGTVVGGTEILRKAFRSDEATVCSADSCAVGPPSASGWPPPTDQRPDQETNQRTNQRTDEGWPPGAQTHTTDRRVRPANHDEQW